MTDQPGLSRESFVVVVVVCAAVVALVLLYLFISILRSRRTSAVPLPPVQPLAHHRQSKVESWHGEQPRLPLTSLGTSSSKSSLLPGHSPLRGSVPVDSLPSRSFQDLAQSSSSFTSTTDLLSTPPAHPRYPRPLSASSLSTTATPTTSRNTLRSAPHAPHHQIQIVLPAPLAPSPHRHSSFQGDLHDGARLSAVDMWVPVGRDNVGTGLRSHINSGSSLRISPSYPPSPDITTSHEKL